MPAAEERDEHLLDHQVLAKYDAAKMFLDGDESAQDGGEFSGGFCGHE